MNDAFAGEVVALREAATERARMRPTPAFHGEVRDDVMQDVPVRYYVPHDAGAEAVVVFLHGGYGVFGDLDLQDAWCRRLAGGWGTAIVSVDYPLAPEHTLSDSVDAVVGVIEAVSAAAARSRANPSPVLAGDSAGAALALASAVTLATQGKRPPSGLLLTNPNIDLTLRRFDPTHDGPDHALSRRAFGTWTRGWAPAADFVGHAEALPPTFVAVGRRDAVLPEARDLAASLAAAGQRHEFVEFDAGHGFLTDARLSDDVVRRSRSFFAWRGAMRPTTGRTGTT